VRAGRDESVVKSGGAIADKSFVAVKEEGLYSAGHIHENALEAIAVASPAVDHPDWRLGSMIGRSPAMQRIFSQMRCTARHLRIATIEGESGTGKTLAAQTLYELGGASGGPFILFPATHFFQQGTALASLTALAADTREGTLFLSHVEELSLDQQARLIAFLQWMDHQQARRTPEPTPRQVLFSSRTPLRRLATSPHFRADLCHRLTAIRFIMPPLRERREDLPLLADSFARQFSSVHGKALNGIGPQALQRLAAHSWPGNVRELQSVINTAALDCEGQWIRPIDLPALLPALDPPPVEGAQPEDDPNLDRVILRHIHRVLISADGNKLRAAKLLGISRSTLYRLLDGEQMSTPVEHARLNSRS
jgi:DNA-binding NtrC family response regulator